MSHHSHQFAGATFVVVPPHAPPNSTGTKIFHQTAHFIGNQIEIPLSLCTIGAFQEISPKIMRKLHLYIAMSLDGFIAGHDGNLDFLSTVHRDDEDYGYHAFVKGIDTVIMGRKTYDKVLSFGIDYPHQDKTSYIITRQTRPSEGNVHFYNGSLKALVGNLKSQEGKDIYCDGGAEIVTELRKHRLIDAYTISIIPTLLGDGIRLFPDGFAEERLKLVQSKSFESGLVQVSYEL